MWRFGIAILAIAVHAKAAGFSFTIGNPVASQDFQCTDLAKLAVSATAEGIVKTERRSVALKVVTGTKPGVYAVSQSWPSEGVWVVNLKGTCGDLSAGAIVPFGPKGFIRDSAKFFPRPPTGGEIQASLEALSRGGNQ